MQKTVVLVSLLCIAGAAAFAPATLPLKRTDAFRSMQLGNSRRVSQQQTKMGLASAPVSLATLSEHFTTSQILVRGIIIWHLMQNEFFGFHCVR
jgi:hypothetical protein